MGSILLTFGVGLILISTSWVQSGILKKFVDDFQETTNQDISFERIRLQWNGKFELTGLFIGDHHKDTLAYIEKIETSFHDFNKLQKNDFEFKRIEASGVYVNIKKYNEEKEHSLKVLVQKLKRESINRNKSILTVDEIDLHNTKFSYTDLNKERKPIQADSLTVFAQNLNFNADSLSLRLNDLKGSLISPFNENIETAAMMIYRPGSLWLEEWKLLSGSTEVVGSLKLQGSNDSFRNFNEQGKFELVVKQS